jgi:hypothetical protein
MASSYPRRPAPGIATVRTVAELDRVTFVDCPTDSLDTVYVYDDPVVPFSLGRLTSIVRDDRAAAPAATPTSTPSPTPSSSTAARSGTAGARTARRRS